MATTPMDSLSPLGNESEANLEKSLHCPQTSATLKSSDSSSDEERNTKTGPNKSSQHSLSSSQSQKRPMNAFLIFCKKQRSVVRQKYPHLENRSITKILGELWGALDGEAKQKYTEIARRNKEAFMKANPHFKWYKTTDLRPPMQPPSPPAAPQPQSNASNQTLNNSQTPQNNTSTPKPPKKRYLENGEFKGSTNSTNNTGNSNAMSSLPKVSAGNAPAGGPPILDIETANRVIENALSGASSSYKDSGIHSAFNSELISSHINNVIEEHTRNEEHDNSSRNHSRSPSRKTATSDHNSSAVATQSTTNSATKSISSPHMPSDDDLYDDNDDDKPLNLSSSTVLHTSNQHIIDHFIDKLLSTGTDGKPSNSFLMNENTNGGTERNDELGCATQRMDCDGCDGLAALAEVALRQASNSVS